MDRQEQLFETGADCVGPSEFSADSIEMAELSYETALRVAINLEEIPNCPRSDAGRKVRARFLRRWCTGCDLDGEYWPPNKQATWLEEEILLKWDEYLGPKALKAVFDARFHPNAAHAAGNGFKDLGEKPDLCGTCQGSGWVKIDGKIQACSCGLMTPLLLDLVIDWDQKKSLGAPRRSSHCSNPFGGKPPKKRSR
jgi:hypothetical protein